MGSGDGEGLREQAGEVLLDPLAHDFPVTDETLEGRGDLAALPDTVAGVEPSAARSFEALNAATSSAPSLSSTSEPWAG